MKIIIILDTIMPMLAAFQLCRAIYHSYILESKLFASKNQLEKVGLIYLLSEDKMLLQRMGRIVMMLLVVGNFLLSSWGVSRIINNFAAYATGWITTTAVLYHLIMLTIAQFIYMIYKRSDLSFLKKFKI